jgi:hypothetical protein
MTSDWMKRTEFLANIAIIILALIIGGAFAKRYLFSNVKTERAEIRAGEKVSLEGIDWVKNERTLLLALQSDCRFCSESAPFYRRLTQELGEPRAVRLIAVLPQQVDDGQKYLNELDVTVDEVKQVSFESLKVGGTPTLILVDSAGVVERVWLGKLSFTQEAEVLSRLK